MIDECKPMSYLDALSIPRQPAMRKPLYAQVREQLLARVRSGEWGAGDSLPNEYVLSSDFDVSIGTVRRAVSDLEASGVLLRKQGRGTYVSGQGPAALQSKFCALRSPQGDRLDARFELISITRRAAPESELGRLPSAKSHGVIEILQRIESNELTLGIERSILPAARVPRIETQLQFGQHLYPLLADYGLLVTRVEDTIGIEPASDRVIAHLACGETKSLLAVARTAFALDGEPVELREAHYLPELVRYAGAARAL